MKNVIKWVCAFLVAIALIAATAFVSFKAAYRSFKDETFIAQNNKISFDEEKVDEYLLAKFKDVKKRIESDFLLEYEENALVEGAIKGMVDKLGDSDTKYYNAQQLKERNEQLQGEYIGTGMDISIQNTEYILIGSVKNDTPAAYAGLKAGDKIIKIDNKKLSEYKESEIWTAFGEENRKIALSVLRGEESLEVDIIVSSIVEQSVFSEMLDTKTGYLRIAMFDAKTATEFETEINGLLTKGMQRLVLDLRDNSGGLASEMSRVADSILADGMEIYYEVDKSGEKKQVKFSDAKALNIPIVVLINGHTASVAEVFVSALRDNGIAKLVGTTSSGKAVSQVVVPYEDGTGLVITVVQFFTKSKYDIQGNGLIPDVVIEPTSEYKNANVQYIPKENDIQLEKAIEVLING